MKIAWFVVIKTKGDHLVYRPKHFGLVVLVGLVWFGFEFSISDSYNT